MSTTDTRPDTAQTRAQDDARLWAAAHLADLPEVIRFREKTVRTIVDTQGRELREAFTVTVRLEEPRRFMIHLYAGATTHDLEVARLVIYRGRHNGLTDAVEGGRLWERTSSGWRWTGHVIQDGCERHDRELHECVDEACVEQFHQLLDGEPDEPCQLETQQVHDWCSIFAFRYPGELWEASASTSGDPTEGPQGLQEIHDFAEAYARVQAECDRLNAQTEER